MKLLNCLPLILLWTGFLDLSATAQTLPDQSLGGESSRIRRTRIRDLDSDLIEGGARRGDALFHSFRELNVESGRGLYFSDPGVRSIFSRVTGSNPSRINGVLGVEGGSANLFLLNPNGILFGANARLDLRGAFVGTTADAVRFSDFTFSATTANPVPLLTISTPIGLNFGTPHPEAAIAVEGNGHQVDLVGPSLLSLNNPMVGAGEALGGISVDSGQTLALLSPNIVLDGGVVTAPSGHLEIAAVQTGTVQFDSSFDFDYTAARRFGTIQFRRAALADASGNPGGSLSIRAETIGMSPGSYAMVQNNGAVPAGEIDVQTNRLELGQAPAPPQPNARPSLTQGGVWSGATTTGTGSNIRVRANVISARAGGVIRSYSTETGRAGSVWVNANTIRLVGGQPQRVQSFPPLIQSSAVGASSSGNVQIRANQINLLDGAVISTNTASPDPADAGGRLSIDANRILIRGVNPLIRIRSTIGTAADGNADAGELQINTRSLVIEDGGNLASLATGQGSSGDIMVQADQIIIRGNATPFEIPAPADLTFRQDGELVLDPQVLNSAIASSTSSNSFDFTGLDPDDARGRVGDVTINTNSLEIVDQGYIFLANRGTQRGGDLSITAESLNLDRGGVLSISLGNRGGNIAINTGSLSMRNRSLLTTSARQTFTGGNVFVNSSSLTLDNSAISADAERSRGGQVEISSDVFLSRDSTVTARSDLGSQFSGTVQITAPSFPGYQSELPETVAASEQIVQQCPGQQTQPDSSSFIVSGTGGTSPTPLGINNSLLPWSSNEPRQAAGEVITPAQTRPPLVEAQGWHYSAENKVVLVAPLTTTVPVATAPTDCTT